MMEKKKERKKKKNEIEIFTFNYEKKYWNSGAIFDIRIAKGFHL